MRIVNHIVEARDDHDLETWTVAHPHCPSYWERVNNGIAKCASEFKEPGQPDGFWHFQAKHFHRRELPTPIGRGLAPEAM